MSYNRNINDQMTSDYGHPSSRAPYLQSGINDIYGTTTGTTGRIIDDPLRQNANLQAMNNPQMQPQHGYSNTPNQDLNYSGPMTDKQNVDQSSNIMDSAGTHDQFHNESVNAGAGSYSQAHRGSVGSTDSYNQGKRGSVGSIGSSKGRKRSSIGSAYAAAGSFGAVGAPTQRLNDQDSYVRDLPSGGRHNIDPLANATEADRAQNMNSGMPTTGGIDSTHPYNQSYDTYGATEDTHTRATASDKVKGNLEKLAGKITGNQTKVIHGENVANGHNI